VTEDPEVCLDNETFSFGQKIEPVEGCLENDVLSPEDGSDLTDVCDGVSGNNTCVPVGDIAGGIVACGVGGTCVDATCAGAAGGGPNVDPDGGPNVDPDGGPDVNPDGGPDVNPDGATCVGIFDVTMPLPDMGYGFHDLDISCMVSRHWFFS